MEKLTINNNNLIPVLARDWVLTQSDGSFDLDNNVKNERFEINAATGHIASLCDGKKTLEQIISELRDTYPDSADDIQGDVEGVLRELVDHEVITFSLTKEEPTVFPIQERSIEHGKRRLCIGMATYDDYDGVYFSIQAIRLFHPEVCDEIEFVVVDNHPDGPCAEALKKLEDWVTHYRYIPCSSVRGTAIRDVIFREANADYVLCMDSHVFMAPGSLARLLTYFNKNPNCQDLLQGPLINDDMKNLSSHFKPQWSGGMFGTWGLDERANDENGETFDIPSQGLGIFCCSKEAWLGFNPRFAGFGGEEGYIHEKFRQVGRHTLCLPFLRWLHRFNRPLGTRYEVSWDDRIRNYMIGLDENNLPIEEMQLHFEELIGESAARNSIAATKTELDSPLYYFDAIYCTQPEQTVTAVSTNQYRPHGINRRLKVICASKEERSVETSTATLSAHLQAIEEADNLAFEHILVLHTDVNFPEEIKPTATQAIRALSDKNWELCIIKVKNAPKSATNNIAGVAYHRNTYAAQLQNLNAANLDFNNYINNHKQAVVIEI